MNYCEVFASSLTPCLDFMLFIVWPLLIFLLLGWAHWRGKHK